MANHIIRDLISEIRGGFFSIICDEYTDISNKEQLTICIRWVDKELEPHEDFIGFYNVPDIGVETTVSAIKDVLLTLQLSLVNCRGQCYDGASNMMGHKTGVAKRIQDLKALSGKRVACLTKDVLQKIRNDTSFRSFYDVVLLKSKSCPSMSGPMLPRRIHAPRRIEIGTGEPTYPVTAQYYYRRIYFEAIDLMMNVIDQRFDQPSFDTYANRKSLLIKTLNSRDKSEELKFMEKLYNDDVNISVLTAQMEILKVLLKDGDYFCFDDIIVKIKELLNLEREMIKEVMTLCKLILVNLALNQCSR